MNDEHSRARIVRYDAEGATDADRSHHGPVSLLVEITRTEARPGHTLLAIGSPGEIDAHPGASSGERRDLSGHVLLPGLVNAHTHLDLTHIGPRVREGDGFAEFAKVVAEGRRTDEPGVREAVRRGVELSLEAGTVAVEDIVGPIAGELSLAGLEELAASPMLGVSLLEFFGIGSGEQAWRDKLDRTLEGFEQSGGPVRLGLQPHAPYSTSPPMYLHAVELSHRLGLPLSTHLAEHRDEAEFVATCSGPMRDFLDRLGIYDESVPRHVGRGRHPIEHLASVLEAAQETEHPFLCAHVNDAPDEWIGVLAHTGASVVYCPHASAYFLAERDFGPHRYRAMLDAGVNVCLGTDSIINLPTDECGRAMSVLEESRLLHRRDGTDPRTLIRMATVNGARALGLDPDLFRLTPGPLAGLVGVPIDPDRADDSLGAVLDGSEPPVLLLPEKSSR